MGQRLRAGAREDDGAAQLPQHGAGDRLINRIVLGQQHVHAQRARGLRLRGARVMGPGLRIRGLFERGRRAYLH